MKEERFFYVPDAGSRNELPQEEAVHATRVLRLQEGDDMFIIDGEGNIYEAVATMTSGKRCSYAIKYKQPQGRLWTRNIHIAMAPTKMMERVEWLAEKATEIGIDGLSFLECRFSERRQLRVDRIEKIVVAAMKQSHKAWKPEISGMVPFRQFIDQERSGRKFICHCYNEIERRNLFEMLKEPQRADSAAAQRQTTDEVTILIGPEGDFSLEEVQYAVSHGYVSASLGESRLRTETAALSAVMMAHLE